MKQGIILLALAMVASHAIATKAHAAVDRLTLKENDAYFQVKEVKFTEEVPSAEDEFGSFLIAPEPTPAPPPVLNPSGQPAIWDMILNGDWNAIMLVGNKILEIVKANQAVVNIKRDVVHAVPAGINDWQLLSGWQMPMTKVFRITMKNNFNMTVVNVRVKVSAMWGGSAAGRGAYLSNVVIVPTETYVAWGWNLDLWSENRDPVNGGTIEAPIAGLGFDIRYKVKSMLNEMSGTQDYYITGDGKLQALE